MIIVRFLALAAVGLAAAACSSDDGGRVEATDEIVETQLEFGPFSAIDIEGPFDVQLVSDGGSSVEVRVDRALWDLTTVQLRDRGRLVVEVEDDMTIEGELMAELDIHVSALDVIELGGTIAVGAAEIIGPTRAIAISGASAFDFESVDANELELDVSGASRVSGTVSIDSRLVLEASGASRSDLEGSAATASVELSGASELDGTTLIVGTADVDFSGASIGSLDVTSSVSGQLSGASTLRVPEGTAVDVESSGGSDVRTTES